MKKLLLATVVIALSFISGVATGAETFTVDPRHTFPAFEVKHMGLSTQRGRFNSTKGKVTLDREAKAVSIDIEIDARTIDTGLKELEKHLKAEDFFNVKRFPKITFKSGKAVFDGNGPKAIKGELTLLGKTLPVTLDVSSFSCREHPMTKKYVCGADASATIRRSDFGMGYAVPMVSDEVRLSVSIEAIRN
jgi:polyisoprenoid-binding protein YceI